MTIISTLCGSGIGGALMWLWNYRNNKRIADAEASKAEYDTTTTMLTNMQLSIDSMKEALDIAKADRDAYHELASSLQNQLNDALMKIDELLRRNEAAEALICIHKGCRVRKPELGMAGKYYEYNSADGDLECDNMSIEDIIAEGR